MKISESTHIIRFPDCDPFNHLNNSRYIDYLINAREDHLVKNYDFPIYQYAAQTGTSWVVGQNKIAYLSPAYLMEKVLIQSCVLQLNSSDILVEMLMWDAEKKKLKAVLWSSFVHIDLKTQKRIEHNEALMEQFTPLVQSLPHAIDFDERVAFVRGKSSIAIHAAEQAAT
jgi:YbgC/YbaW family acyl-CoA thioester hydrolase